MYALLPFTTTTSCIKSARTIPQKTLFDLARNTNIKKKMLSTRLGQTSVRKCAPVEGLHLLQEEGEKHEENNSPITKDVGRIIAIT